MPPCMLEIRSGLARTTRPPVMSLEWPRNAHANQNSPLILKFVALIGQEPVTRGNRRIFFVSWLNFYRFAMFVWRWKVMSRKALMLYFGRKIQDPFNRIEYVFLGDERKVVLLRVFNFSNLLLVNFVVILAEDFSSYVLWIIWMTIKM